MEIETECVCEHCGKTTRVIVEIEPEDFRMDRD